MYDIINNQIVQKLDVKNLHIQIINIKARILPNLAKVKNKNITSELINNITANIKSSKQKTLK